MNKERFKIDLQGLMRTALTIGAVIGAYYFDRENLNEKILENRTAYARLENSFNAHCQNVPNYSMEQLTDKFILRREWDAFNIRLSENLKYIQSRLDILIEKISEKNSEKNYKLE